MKITKNRLIALSVLMGTLITISGTAFAGPRHNPRHRHSPYRIEYRRPPHHLPRPPHMRPRPPMPPAPPMLQPYYGNSDTSSSESMGAGDAFKQALANSAGEVIGEALGNVAGEIIGGIFRR